jgi:hypothetical protein
LNTQEREEATRRMVEIQQSICRVAHLVRSTHIYDIVVAQMDDLSAIESALIPDRSTRDAQAA